MNGGTCTNLGGGVYICTCPAAFTGNKFNQNINNKIFLLGPDCNIPLCVTNSCFNGGTCLIQNGTLRCQCPCGFSGKKVQSFLKILNSCLIKVLDVKLRLIYVR
jgi:hypothetical protein